MEPVTQHPLGEASEYNLLFNEDNAINALEGEVEYNFFSSSMIINNSNDNINIIPKDNLNSNDPEQALIGNEIAAHAQQPQSDDELLYLQQEGMIDELKTIYNKLGFASIFVTLFCIIALIAGIANNFYNWNGITFNIFVLIGGIIGLQCGVYYDFKKGPDTSKLQIRKLKILLLYFIICIIFSIIIFGIQIVYLILIPHRKHDEYSTSIMIGCMIFYVFGIIFWIIFVSFYIDLCARACLKRGRIDFVIITLKNDNTSYGIWLKIYYLVIQFRLGFRKVRRFLTQITGIHCFKGRIKRTPANPGKVHEEEKVLDMLDEKDERIQDDICCASYTCDIKRKLSVAMSNFGKCMVMFICCPCLMMSRVCEKCNPCYILSTIVFAYIFMPLFVLIVMMMIAAAPFIIGECMPKGSNGTLFGMMFVFVCPIWIFMWWWGICKGSTLTMTSDRWDWNAQCVMWNYTTIIFLEIVVEALSSSNN